MQDATVATRGDDRAVGRHLRTALAELVVQLGLQAELMQPCAAGLHRTHMGTCRDIRCATHDLDFRSGLVQAHVVQQMVQGHEFLGRLGTEVRLGANHVDPVHQVPVEFGIAAHCRIHPVPAFDQAGQDFIDVIDGERIVRTILTDRAFLSCAQAFPQLALGIALAAEQYVLAVLTTGDQHHHRFRLGKAAQVLKVAVLPVDVLDVTIANGNRSGRQDGNAVRLHLSHQSLAAAGVLGLRDLNHGQQAS